LKALPDDAARLRRLQAEGYNVTVEEITQILSQAKLADELSDADLEKVAGGFSETGKHALEGIGGAVGGLAAIGVVAKVADNLAWQPSAEPSGKLEVPFIGETDPQYERQRFANDLTGAVKEDYFNGQDFNVDNVNRLQVQADAANLQANGMKPQLDNSRVPDVGDDSMKLVIEETTLNKLGGEADSEGKGDSEGGDVADGEFEDLA
jgi:predicted ribosomally synthesized peptide with nif11-like leader